jgi:hypothetical protein
LPTDLIVKSTVRFGKRTAWAGPAICNSLLVDFVDKAEFGAGKLDAIFLGKRRCSFGISANSIWTTCIRVGDADRCTARCSAVRGFGAVQ